MVSLSRFCSNSMGKPRKEAPGAGVQPSDDLSSLPVWATIPDSPEYEILNEMSKPALKPKHKVELEELLCNLTVNEYLPPGTTNSQ